MDALFGIMTAFGLSASAGLNAYIPLLVVGVIAHYTDWINLNPPYDLLSNPWVLIVVGMLLIVEMLADKIPAVNHVNDHHPDRHSPGSRSDHLRRQRPCHHQCSPGDRDHLRFAGIGECRMSSNPRRCARRSLPRPAAQAMCRSASRKMSSRRFCPFFRSSSRSWWSFS